MHEVTRYHLRLHKFMLKVTKHALCESAFSTYKIISAQQVWLFPVFGLKLLKPIYMLMKPGNISKYIEKKTKEHGTQSAYKGK